jgi:hypothetical protein
MKSLKIILIIVLMTVLSSLNYAVFFMNDIVDGFGNGDGKNQAIEEYVVAGAKSFIESHRTILAVIQEFEINSYQNVNIPSSLTFTETALKQLQNSREQYIKALETAGQIGYNLAMIDKFKVFDYDGYINKYGLNKEIAGIVKKYLKEGDLLGIYRENIDNINNIINILVSIRDTLESGDKPALGILWDCIQQYSTSLLLGNYATRFSIKIIKNIE